MHTATVGVPTLPCGCGAVVYHIKVTGIVALLQYVVHQFGLMVARSPLGEYRHARQTYGYVGAVLSARQFNQFAVHAFIKRVGHYTCEHGIRHVERRAGSVCGVGGIVETVVYGAVELQPPLFKSIGVGSVSQYARNSRNRLQTVAHEAVAHQLHRPSVAGIHTGRSEPVAQIPDAVVRVGPAAEQSVGGVAVDIR